MRSYVLTPQAIHDLEEIHDFIALDNIDAALQFVDLLEEKMQFIAGTPEMGRRREELALGLRSFPIGHYVIFYRLLKERIEIIRVLHGGRDIETIFED